MNEAKRTEIMDGGKKCPQCGASLPAGALDGLCPACLLKQGATAETATQPEAASFHPPDVAEVARLFPQLEILAFIGQGGMGAVYKARQPPLDRLVALKILSPQAAAGSGFAERFNREARALAKLNHPNIVAVHEFGQTGRSDVRVAPAGTCGDTDAAAPGMPFFIMEFVDGLTLRQLARAGGLSPREALQIVPQICEALQFAHDEGVVHRDIKPENILLDKKGRVKIADFGIAKIMGREPDAAMTETKAAIGTPHYMAPEQVEKPQTVDHRADIYSLGVVFYEMLTGELPLGKFAPPSRKVEVDVRLDEVVLRALEKEPELRYQQASVLKTEVEAISSTPTPGRLGISPQSAARDAVWFKTSLLPELLPGERVVHFKKHLWAVLNKSLPTYRFFFSLPPLWAAGMYVTDRRLLFSAHALGLLAQEFSIWFPGKAPDEQRERLQKVSTGKSRWLGDFLEIKSEAARKRWYRGRELRLRLYMRQPERLYDQIAAASLGAALAQRAAQAPWEAPIDKSEIQNPRPEKTANGRLRFAHTAIFGALWTGLFFLNWMVSYTPSGWALTALARDSLGRVATGLFLSGPLAVLGWAAPVGATALGMAALRQIRRSRRTLGGFGLSLFDVLFFPLLALNGWMVWLASQVVTQVSLAGPAAGTPSKASAWVVITLVLVALGLNGMAIRAAWRRANRYVNTPAPPAQPRVTGTWAAVFKQAGLRLLLVVAVCLALFETLQQSSVHWQESTGELWMMALAVGSLAGLVWAFWPGFHLKRSPAFWLSGTIASAFLMLAITTFFYRTREGSMGFLQIAGLASPSPGVKIRYKQVSEADGESPKPSPANEPADLRMAKVKLAALRSRYREQHPLVQEALKRVAELEQLSIEEPHAPADLREAKANLAGLRSDYSEQHPVVQKALKRVAELERLSIAEPNAPADLREAKANLAELRSDYGEAHPDVQAALAGVKELERIGREEPNASPQLRAAKANLAGLRSDYGEEHPDVQAALAGVKELERIGREEPNASPQLRAAKARLAELRVSYAEGHPEIGKQIAVIEALERKK